MMIGEAMREDGDPPAGLPTGGTIVVHGECVAIVEIDSPQDRPVFRQALGHERGADGLSVRAAQPPGGLESRRRFCGTVGRHGQEFTILVGTIPCSPAWLGALPCTRFRPLRSASSGAICPFRPRLCPFGAPYGCFVLLCFLDG